MSAWFDLDYLNTCCKATRNADPPVDPDTVWSYISIASEIMYYWLGRQFRGRCEATFRPEVHGCICGRDYAIQGDDPSGGGTWNGACSCGWPSLNQIDLGYFPVTSINSIWMNGAAQVVANYHIDEYRFLVANNGGCFPTTNNLYSEPGDANDVEGKYVFEVSICYGQSVPELAKRAAARLACELIKGCMDLPCMLPERTISVVRQGISTQQFSSQDILNQGLIGILEIDLAIQAYNPDHLRSPAFVWSPDLVRGGRRTHTG